VEQHAQSKRDFEPTMETSNKCRTDWQSFKGATATFVKVNIQYIALYSHPYIVQSPGKQHTGERAV
jgi:hypothetical protein